MFAFVLDPSFNFLPYKNTFEQSLNTSGHHITMYNICASSPPFCFSVNLYCSFNV